MDKMRAAVLHGINDLRIEEVNIPDLDERDVLVKVSACGVCGSDIPRVLKTGTYHFPTIPGHEFGGYITKVGKKVKKDLLGKKVAVIPLIPCHECKMCEIGHYAQCENYDYLGSRNDGGFAEYVKVPEKNVVVVPETFDDDSVAYIEPVSVALHAVRNVGVNYGDSVAVFGLGAIGIFVAQWAKAFGAKHVFAIDLDSKKVDTAKEIGLLDALCGTGMDLEMKLNAIAPEGIDVIFDASGAAPVINQALDLLKSEGRLGLLGRPTKDVILNNASFEKILRKQIIIKGTWSFEFKEMPHHDWKQSVEAIEQGKIKTIPIVSHRMPLEKTKEAIDLMANKKEYFHKILIIPSME